MLFLSSAATLPLQQDRLRKAIAGLSGCTFSPEEDRVSIGRLPRHWCGMHDLDLKNATVEELFASRVANGRMLHEELLGIAQRTAGYATQHEQPLADAPPLPPLVLRLDRMESGDILLSHGGEMESHAIAWLSGGAFSHAALWISPISTLESDGGLIDEKLTRHFGYAWLGTEHIAVGEIAGAPATCMVYRHPGMSSVPVECFAAALLAELRESWGKDYSEKHRLVMLARLPAGLAVANRLVPLAAKATRAWERWRARDKIHGAFCSELVARFFQRLGFPLFDQERPPERVSPNHLARSALRPVEGAVVESKHLHGVWHDEPIDQLRFKFAKALVQERRQQRGVERELAQFKELKQSASMDLAQQFVKMTMDFQQERAPLLEIMRTSSGLGQPHLVRRARRLEDQYKSLEPAVSKLWKADAPKREEVDDVLDALNRFQCSLRRCHILVQARQLRLAARGDGEPTHAWRRFQLRRERKRLLKQARAVR